MAHAFRLRLLLVAIGAAAGLAMAQQPSVPDAVPVPAISSDTNPANSTLDSILAALDANVASYSHTVPSFFCSERVDSEMEPAPDPGGMRRTIIESTFRVRRSAGTDGQAAFQESRSLKSIDGKLPPPGADESSELIGPVAVFGVFSYGMDLVSAKGEGCFRYRLRPPRKGRPTDRIVIEFEGLPARERSAGCPSNGRLSGRAFVNPSDLRMVRLETKARDHTSLEGMKETWDWAVDYAPVTLSGKTYWMPSAIHSKSVRDEADGPGVVVSNGGGGKRGGSTTTMGSSVGRPLTYTLEARYSDYHLLTVSSRIVPVAGAGENSPPDAGPTPPPDH
jgi:hypothetical protein